LGWLSVGATGAAPGAAGGLGAAAGADTGTSAAGIVGGSVLVTWLSATWSVHSVPFQ
jgi:hypothetical protein